MSLINDALKRAKETQQHAPSPSPGPQLRPAEPAQYARHSLGLIVPVGLAIVALLGLFLAWRLFQKQAPADPVEVRAQTPADAPPTPVSPAAAPVSTAPASVSSDASNAPTNSSVATEPAPPKPAPLRLQVIVYNPARPSAMISGKTVFIGDRIGEFRVVAINKESATLTGAGQTNVLNLSD
ncbi:MAG TPA: hypothetical protein VN578_13090 [Candidatus Binatia bacterium]|jgi:hypothetical protein|nr:hypothetical protein [Candidatus Binatia bacterium]